MEAKQQRRRGPNTRGHAPPRQSTGRSLRKGLFLGVMASLFLLLVLLGFQGASPGWLGTSGRPLSFHKNLRTSTQEWGEDGGERRKDEGYKNLRASTQDRGEDGGERRKDEGYTLQEAQPKQWKHRSVSGEVAASGDESSSLSARIDALAKRAPLFLTRKSCFPDNKGGKWAKKDPLRKCVQLGTDYGSFVVPADDPLFAENGGSAVYYGFGCGEDISFDLAVAALYPKATIRLFDPTPRAIDHMTAVFDAIRDHKAPPSVPQSKDLYMYKGQAHEISGKFDAMRWFQHALSLSLRLSSFSHYPFAMWTKDKKLTFNAPSGAGVSFSLTKDSGSSKIEVQARSLESLMAELGDERVDVLKIDIEGAEKQVIPHLSRVFKSWPRSRWPRYVLFDMDHEYHDVAGRDAMQELGYELVAQQDHDLTWELPSVA